MTDAEQIEALRREVELLRGRVEEIAARANAEPRDEDPDADDFGGGGVPDEGGHVGRPPEGFVENFAVPIPTDTQVAEDPNALQYKSVDEREADQSSEAALQIHDFDEELPSGTGLRKVELKLVTTTGTGGGTFLVLVDPDDNEVPGTKWMIPLRESDTGGREIKWAAFGGKVDASGLGGNAETDTEQSPGNPPGESVEHYHATGETGGPLQIRGFQEDAAKALKYTGEGHTSGITLANAEVIVRDTTSRKRVEYVPASTFWLQGATAGQNFATSIKLGTAGNYITIDTTS